MPYHTKQQQAVLRVLEARREESVTAAELAEELRRGGCPVGIATIYRQLEKLEQSGLIHKVSTEDGAFYQYCDHPSGERDCFLFKCERCGRILHLDCSRLQELYGQLEAEHHFHINPHKTLFTGLCEDCSREEESGDGK